MADRDSPRQSATVALVWALAFAGVGVGGWMSAEPVFVLGRTPAPLAWNWYPVVVAAVACTCVQLAGRVAGPVAQVSRRGLWVCVALSAVSAFGVLMDAVELAFNQRLDDGLAAAHHALGLAGVCLLAARARAGSASAAGCPVRQRGNAAGNRACSPRRARVAAGAGAAALVPYITVKLVWALGGTFAGISGEDVSRAARQHGASRLSRILTEHGLDPTVLLAVLGVLLIVRLAIPRTLRLPRWAPVIGGRLLPPWLLLVPAVVGVSTLLPYGSIGLVYLTAASAGVVTLPRGDFPTAADAELVAWIGLGTFGAYGAALAVVTRCHWLATRRARTSTAAPR
jgi:D-alanyl-D-alanine dipeptidase